MQAPQLAMSASDSPRLLARIRPFPSTLLYLSDCFNPYRGSLAKNQIFGYDGRMSTSPLPPRPCAQCATVFRPTSPRNANKYCSHACYWAAKRTPGKPATRLCAREGCGREFSTARRGADPRYCSQACFGLARRKPTETIVCPECGQPRTYAAGARDGRRFCSRECAARHRRRPRRAYTCPQCGRDFERPAWARAVHYCSVACQNAARSSGPRMARVCAACGRGFTVSPSVAARGYGRYCSRACRWAAHPRPEITCQVCGRRRRVSTWHLAHGYGKYCSRAHYGEAKRQARLLLECPRVGCGKRFTAPPSQRGRKYCSQRCVRLDHAPRQYRCQSCQSQFRAAPWRKPRFCSQECSHRPGRQYARRPELLARNARILELHGQALKASVIQQRLIEESPEWWASEAVIYQVVSLARRQPAGR
jgi:hypothetical protein